MAELKSTDLERTQRQTGRRRSANFGSGRYLKGIQETLSTPFITPVSDISRPIPINEVLSALAGASDETTRYLAHKEKEADIQIDKYLAKAEAHGLAGEESPGFKTKEVRDAFQSGRGSRYGTIDASELPNRFMLPPDDENAIRINPEDSIKDVIARITKDNVSGLPDAFRDSYIASFTPRAATAVAFQIKKLRAEMVTESLIDHSSQLFDAPIDTLPGILENALAVGRAGGIADEKIYGTVLLGAAQNSASHGLIKHTKALTDLMPSYMAKQANHLNEVAEDVLAKHVVEDLRSKILLGTETPENILQEARDYLDNKIITSDDYVRISGIISTTTSKKQNQENDAFQINQVYRASLGSPGSIAAMANVLTYTDQNGAERTIPDVKEAITKLAMNDLGLPGRNDAGELIFTGRVVDEIEARLRTETEPAEIARLEQKLADPVQLLKEIRARQFKWLVQERQKFEPFSKLILVAQTLDPIAIQTDGTTPLQLESIEFIAQMRTFNRPLFKAHLNEEQEIFIGLISDYRSSGMKLSTAVLQARKKIASLDNYEAPVGGDEFNAAWDRLKEDTGFFGSWFFGDVKNPDLIKGMLSRQIHLLKNSFSSVEEVVKLAEKRTREDIVVINGYAFDNSRGTIPQDFEIVNNIGATQYFRDMAAPTDKRSAIHDVQASFLPEDRREEYMAKLKEDIGDQTDLVYIPYGDNVLVLTNTETMAPVEGWDTHPMGFLTSTELNQLGKAHKENKLKIEHFIIRHNQNILNSLGGTEEDLFQQGRDNIDERVKKLKLDPMVAFGSGFFRIDLVEIDEKTNIAQQHYIRGQRARLDEINKKVDRHNEMPLAELRKVWAGIVEDRPTPKDPDKLLPRTFPEVVNQWESLND